MDEPPDKAPPPETPQTPASPLATFLGCLGLAYGLTALGLPFYWVITDSGLAAWVTDAQVSIFPDERYYPVLSWIVPALVLMSPVFIAMAFSKPVDPHPAAPGNDGPEA